MRNVSCVLFLTAFIGQFYWFIGPSNEFPSEKISEDWMRRVVKR